MLFLLLACSGAPDAPAPTVVASPAQPPVVATPTRVDPVDAYKQRLRETAGEVPLAEGKDYGGQFLIILSSKREPGHTPEAVTTLAAHPKLELSPARLMSSQFKGLMPCYEIVVAGGWPSLAEAKAIAGELKGMGVDHYIKNAGEFVGDDPRVASYCDDELDGEDSCSGPARLVSSVDGKATVHLALGEVAEERVLAKAPAVRSLDDSGTLWQAPLQVQTVESWSVGDEVTVLQTESGSTQACAVTGFAALVQGQPHFGWSEYSDQKEPGCGELEVVATLDCALTGQEAAAVAFSSDAAFTPAAPTPDGPTAAQLERFSQSSSAHQAQANAAAKERGAELQQESSEQQWRAGEQTVAQLESTWTTGEGMYFCGGDDLFMQVSALVGADDALIGAVQDITGATTAGLFMLDGEWMQVRGEALGGREIVGADGEATCTLDYAFCDCAC